jgi:methyl-accepting chemotaxis protein
MLVERGHKELKEGAATQLGSQKTWVGGELKQIYELNIQLNQRMGRIAEAVSEANSIAKSSNCDAEKILPSYEEMVERFTAIKERTSEVSQQVCEILELPFWNW